jgi:anaerobic selenocysteine-containing dehydrogenase
MKNNVKKGAKVVVIDPKRIPIADKADMYLKIRPERMVPSHWQ